MLGDIVAVNQRELARVEATITATHQGLGDAQASLEVLTRHRWFRRPDQQAIDETLHRIRAGQRYLGQLHEEHAGWGAEPDRSRRRRAPPRSS